MIAAVLLASCLPLSFSRAAEPPRPYVYRVLRYEVVDGDTIRTTLDLGFHLRIELLARLDVSFVAS